MNAYPDRGIIDIVSSVKTEGWDVSSIMINEDGENIKLILVSFRESVISRWQNKRNGHVTYSFQVVQQVTRPQPNPEDKPGAYLLYEPYDRCEVYYITESGVNLDTDYQRLRHEGNLLWGGVFEEQSSAIPVYNLTNSGRLIANAPNISYYWLYTNSTKISISVSGDDIHENALITLYDTDGMTEIMVMQIRSDNRTGVFTNLTSARNYYVVATGLDGCEITISG